MPILSYDKVDRVRTDLVARQGYVKQKWKICARHVDPYRFREGNRRHDLGRKRQHILKNTAGLSLRTFVSGMSTQATPATSPWFRLALVDPTLSREIGIRRFLEQLEIIAREHLALSNTYRVLPVAYKDVGLFSNAAYAMLPKESHGFYLYPFAIGTFGFANNEMGQVETFYRDFTLSVRQVVERYGKLKPNGHIDWENSLVPWIQQFWDNQDYQQEVSVTNVIIPNDMPMETPLYARDMKFQSYVYLTPEQTGSSSLGTGYSHTNEFGKSVKKVPKGSANRFLQVSGYNYFPVICPRWEVQAEEDYGVNGPTELAISTVLSLNKKEFYRMEGLAKLVRPPMLAPAGLRRHQASILAGGITYYGTGETDALKPAFQVDPKLGELLESMSEDVEFIKSCYYEDLFLMLNQQRPRSHVTKAEIEERAAERISALAPVLGQLDEDQNSRLIENALFILKEQGLLPEAPAQLAGQRIRPEYISVLARAARSAQAASAERAMEFAMGVAEGTGRQELVHRYDLEKIVADYGDNVGLDPHHIREEDEYEEVKQAIVQQQQAMADQERRQQEAAIYKDAAAGDQAEANAQGLLQGAA